MNYYFLMNDKSKFNLCNPQAVLDDKACYNFPIETPSINLPVDVIEGKFMGDLYWNFNKVSEIDFDYLKYEGHILSDFFYENIVNFSIAPHEKRNISVWMEGASTGNVMKYIAFNKYKNNDSESVKSNFRFVDLEKTEWSYGKRNQIIPTGIIYLTEEAKKYDILELSELNMVHRQIVISQRVFDLLNKLQLKGIKYIPIENGVKEYIKDNFILMDRYLKKEKKLP